MSKLPSTWPYEHFEKQFSPAKSSSQSFSELSGIFFRILMKFPLWGCQNWNIRVKANNLRKSFLFEKDAFFVNIGLWKKNFHPFFEFFSTQLSKLHSKCPKEHLEEKDSFSGKNCIFSSIWEIETNFSTFCRYFYGKLIKFALYVSQQRIWGKKYSEKIVFCRSASLSEKF